MAQQGNPFISVIVPVLNGEETLRECVLSLLKAEYPHERREILVVDNGSTDRTAQIARDFPVRYVREERRGTPYARNKGIRVSHGEILLFTDADCLVSRAWLKEIALAFRDDNVGAVAGEVVAYPPRTPAERYAARTRHLSPQRYLARPVLPFAALANLAFRREVFDRIGLFDEGLPWGESTDICTRLRRETALKLQYAAKAIVFHRHRPTAWSFVRQQYKYGKGHAQLYIKYRHVIPWGWRQSLSAYRELSASAWAFGRAGVRATFTAGLNDDFYSCYFEFLKRLAERMGFVTEAVSQGYFYL